MRRTTISKRCFTLLEVMIGIVLITLMSGLVGMKMHRAIQKKQFQSTLERLKARFLVSQKLALSTQADWQGTLKKKDKEWIYETASEEKKKLTPLRFNSIDIYFDGKKVTSLTFDFYASGEVLPQGTLLFKHDSDKEEWKISELISRQEGTKLGPLHPAD